MLSLQTTSFADCREEIEPECKNSCRAIGSSWKSRWPSVIMLLLKVLGHLVSFILKPLAKLHLCF